MRGALGPEKSLGRWVVNAGSMVLVPGRSDQEVIKKKWERCWLAVEKVWLENSEGSRMADAVGNVLIAWKMKCTLSLFPNKAALESKRRKSKRRSKRKRRRRRKRVK